MTVLICTRNRGASIIATIQSVLAAGDSSLRLIVVDQSDDAQTARAIGSLGGDPRLRYVSTHTRGLGLARNIGLALSRDELVLITDDDCVVPPGWVEAMAVPFRAHPRVGVVFCDVTAGPHDPRAGFVPVSRSPRPLRIADLAHWQTCDGVNIGIGAGMAVRRAAALAVGGFNPLFGSGSHFRSADDLEFTLHVLAAGQQIYRTNAVAVLHHGFRTYAQGRALTRNNAFAIGGIYGQLLRRGHALALRYYAGVFADVVLRPALKDLANRRPPRKLGRAAWLLRGLVEGLRLRPAPRTGGLLGLAAARHGGRP